MKCLRCLDWSRQGLSDTCPSCDMTNESIDTTDKIISLIPLLKWEIIPTIEKVIEASFYDGKKTFLRVRRFLSGGRWSLGFRNEFGNRFHTDEKINKALDKAWEDRIKNE